MPGLTEHMIMKKYDDDLQIKKDKRQGNHKHDIQQPDNGLII